jgi:hypothetical protein
MAGFSMMSGGTVRDDVWGVYALDVIPDDSEEGHGCGQVGLIRWIGSMRAEDRKADRMGREATEFSVTAESLPLPYRHYFLDPDWEQRLALKPDRSLPSLLLGMGISKHRLAAREFIPRTQFTLSDIIDTPAQRTEQAKRGAATCKYGS